ncbi:MAG TPA: 16S rRNA (cytidine(1402)-2'-O)-methyltransferase [Legionellaceae bacterium]|nr:16S rRNA (cytidine(1402)-2'-O)-methyltransferase [Legionellaceae bacterium]
MISSSASKTGELYIVGTPIGNLKDISARAIQALEQVDIILSEDTRHSQHLLQHLGIKKPLMAFHAHNEQTKTPEIVKALQQGRSYALISDAGTPLISDPGYPLVHAARLADIPVIPIPGPCAFITALSAAGIPCDTFSFFGFLPAKSKARREKLATLLSLNHTLIFYESTHRIHECLEDLKDLFGAHCELILVKELTKTFERFIQGSITMVIAWLERDPAHAKGEFVIMIPPRPIIPSKQTGKDILALLLQELPLKQAVRLAAVISQTSKNELYQWALDWQKQSGE